ncbi:SMR family transporter [Angustibacter speluncae]
MTAAWLFLVLAMLSEVVATLSLRMAGTGRRAWFVVVGAGYLAAFVLLSQSLAAGMPLGVAYGTWVAAGVALVALASRVLFGEPLTRTMAAGIVLIGAGVLLIELGRAH